MENYKTRITVHGLRRADVNKAKEPIGEGEVIALPFEVARSLLRAGAVEPTDADITVELEWGAPVALVKANDEAALLAALGKLGSKIPTVPEGAVVELADVADSDLLVAVFERLGDGRLSEFDVSRNLTSEQVLRIVGNRLVSGAIGRDELRLLVGMNATEGAGGESETPPAEQSKSDPPTDKPAARGKAKT
ncbi:hypothetical protein [Novosphingobium sp. KACC 22771]|uniref:hypothetical protein n=1 Tax=Novosphingobium sp. KACC 22771 TaxID=3025670 RepID=UPI0023657C8F|nr:hypothetical protein [Novosphingobium sp. KACC 22771]WDF73487.1 hypothetical protein PQ467_05430 [Novosphingobium sp. KACC 22771]